MNDVSSENMLLIGKVIRPHGLNGLLRILSYAQSEKTFLNAGTVLLKSDKTGTAEFKIISIKAHKNAFLMKLKEISSLEDAEKYRGAEILIKKDTLKRENDDEYYLFELIGINVYLESGRFIGILREIINTGSNDIYIVKKDDKEFLIPALTWIVLEVDLINKRMTIADNIDGLLDINEV